MADIFKEGNTAVITGGASGIGLALAKKCAGYGMKVVVADRDEAALAAVPAAVATPYRMDVSRAEDWEGLRAKVHEVLGGRITLLALNAGTGGRHGFGDGDGAAFERILAVNVLGVVHGITTLLPLVRESGGGGGGGGDGDGPAAAVVITGSKQGITNPPGNPAYNASKAAVKSLAEQLAYDLRAAPVAVHLLVPGWTWTGLAGGAPPAGRDAPDAPARKPAAAWWPEEVADYLEAKMRDGQFWVLCPDNEVTEDMDRKRMMWTAEDAIQGRPPLSRWRDEFKEEAAEFMRK